MLAPHLLSELAIVAGMAKATLPPRPSVKWDEWVADYSKVRALIEATYPEKFEDFEARKFTPGGFFKGNAARERIWKTQSGKAEFTTPTTLVSAADAATPQHVGMTTPDLDFASPRAPSPARTRRPQPSLIMHAREAFCRTQRLSHPTPARQAHAHESARPAVDRRLSQRFPTFCNSGAHASHRSMCWQVLALPQASTTPRCSYP